MYVPYTDLFYTRIYPTLHRATAYSVMYDDLRQHRSGVDHLFSPSQQTSTRPTLAYAHARFSAVPGADLVIDPDWPMDTG